MNIVVMKGEHCQPAKKPAVRNAKLIGSENLWRTEKDGLEGNSIDGACLRVCCCLTNRLNYILARDRGKDQSRGYAPVPSPR